MAGKHIMYYLWLNKHKQQRQKRKTCCSQKPRNLGVCFSPTLRNAESSEVLTAAVVWRGTVEVVVVVMVGAAALLLLMMVKGIETVVGVWYVMVLRMWHCWW